MHVYLPLTLDALRDVLERGVVRPAPLTGYSLTPGLRAELPGGDDEELEYLASGLAADAAVLRLAGDPAAPRRRVVLVVDLDPAQVTDHDGLEAGAVRLDAEVPLPRVVSALVDDPAVEPVLIAVLAAPDDAALRGDLDDHGLQWFAAQELSDLVAER